MYGLAIGWGRGKKACFAALCHDSKMLYPTGDTVQSLRPVDYIKVFHKGTRFHLQIVTLQLGKSQHHDSLCFVQNCFWVYNDCGSVP